VLAIIPAYNEATALPGVLRDLHEHLRCAGIVIVNDGSTHAKSAVARGQGA
jgi:glycosyltransferase involved in cell wall biosynthesis